LIDDARTPLIISGPVPQEVTSLTSWNPKSKILLVYNVS
jgi:preprotein translocase subunit SecA